MKQSTYKLNKILAITPQDTICHLIHKQAQNQPQQTAIIDGDQHISFEQFNAKANAVANAINAQGITNGALIGVCMSRTWELIASLLGVMQAGCAYVPLDPKYPQERISYMLEHSRAAAALVDESSQSLCSNVKVRLNVSAIQEHSSNTTNDNFPTSNFPTVDDLAYVIYTSGSTGKPKGVAVEHQSVNSFIKTLSEIFSQEELSGMLATSSVCFDSSITETLGTLSLGGTVILAQSGLDLTEPSIACKVKSCVMIPSVLQTILTGAELPASLRCLVVGGEALKRPLAIQLHQMKPNLRLINVYGPTEDTVFSTTKEITKDIEQITIGNSVTGSRAFILDEQLQKVDIGVAGELYLSGDKLARGYLYDEVKTTERFIEVKLKGESDKIRMYRTGDICQWTTNGEIEFLGRADEQVKIRGFRIELAEIETVLESMQGIEAAAAIAKETASGQKILAAFVATQNTSNTQEHIKSHLAEQLPHYMVPQVITILKELPYMPNGKLDRKQLHSLELTVTKPIETQNENTSLMSLIQNEIASLLNLPDPSQIPPDFALDGFDFDSLSRVELRNRISKSIGNQLPTEVIYQNNTVAALIDYIQNATTGNTPTPNLPTAKRASDSLGNFQALIQASHPTFQAAKAPAWSATDKGKLVQHTVQMVNAQGRNPFGKVIRTGSSARGTVYDPFNTQEHQAIIWTTNLYFGLNRDPEVIKTASEALHQYGTGMGISAAATGMLDYHYEFEKDFANIVGKQAACLFPTGYTANLGGIAGLLGKDDVVIIDSLCHASIVDGAELSGARVRTFQHNNPDDLESVLKSEQSPYHTTLVVIEGVYSMGEGTAPVAQIVKMVKKYDALILVDEAHSFGFYGEKGAGICAQQGVTEQVDFIMATLSKALGSIGGVIAASHEHIELLKSSSRAYIFQASISPADIAAAHASLHKLTSDESLREQLWDRANYMREQFSKAGLDLGTGDGPIVTPHFSDKDKLYAIVQGMSKRGVQTSAVTYPIVEKGRGRLRFICSGAHTKAEIDITLQALLDAEKEAEQMLSQRAQNKMQTPTLPLTEVANWNNRFAKYLSEQLKASKDHWPNQTPNLAIKITIAGNDESSVNLCVDQGKVLTEDIGETDSAAFTIALKSDEAINALCSSDIQTLLNSISNGSCELHGEVEPFIWFIARIHDWKL